jgi:endonuclease YncB( thermonuclease family)
MVDTVHPQVREANHMRFVIALFLALSQTVAAADTFSGHVVRVNDGDTIVILDADNIQHKIRLQGIAAPERGQAFGAKSKQHLSNLVAGKAVIVEYDKYDRYQHVLGKVLLENQDMNLKQIEAGMAWHDKEYQAAQTTTDRIRYSDAEREARRVKRGLWQDANPMAPWDYRQAKRKQREAMKAFEIEVETRNSPY